jgi:hypothetical protein
MRSLLFALLVTTASTGVAAERLKMYDASVREEPSPYAGLDLTPAQLAAAQELELAQYRFAAWANYEYPMRVKRLDADLALSQQELASLQRRQAEFSRFNVWSGGGNPLFLQSEDTQLAIAAAKQRLDLLQADRAQLVKYQGIEYRQRQMELERARLNLRLAR